MDTTTNSPQPGRLRYAKVMKVLIFMCWGAMLFGLIAVIAAGHSGPAELMALGGAIACLAGIFFILYQSMHRMILGKHYMLEGKRLALVFMLAGASVLLVLLSTGLD